MFDNTLSSFVTVLSISTLLYWITVTVDSIRGIWKVKVLSSEPKDAAASLPGVSIIVTAKDEAESISQSLRNLMKLDYPDYEVIVVNDRSTDETPDEIRKVKEEFPSLKVISIDTLPDGWLGKNHACYRGYLEASNDIILFTDADVLFESQAIQSAVNYFINERADHLAVSPLIFGKSFLVRLFVQYFLFSFLIYFRPWAGGMGVGAFNMFRRDAYEKVGTHKEIAMRPDEDLQLGKRVKKMKLRQRFASGKRLMSVEWYSSLREAMEGVEKNAFAGLQYSIVIAAGAVFGQLLFFLFPFLAVILTKGWVQAAYMAVVVLMVLVYLLQLRIFSNNMGLHAIFLPISALLFITAICRALIITIIQGGVQWRGTFYSLRELKDNNRNR